MGVFGAVFGRRGVVGFSVPLLGASSGVGGFNVAMLLRLVREKFALRGLMVGVSAKSSPCTLETPQNRRFYACWANFFAEMPLEGLCWVNFFVEVPVEGSCWASFFAPIGPAPRSCRRRGARGWLRWGFCSIRSWLAACRRRVVPLMTPFPPFGDGPAAPSAASARAPSRRTSPRRARRRSSTTTSSRRRRNMSAARAAAATTGH